MLLRNLFLLGVCGWLLTGCATSTVATRKKERPNAYAALPTDQKEMVDQGQIKMGMNSDAVYLAWGPPAQVLENETPQGHFTVWVYYGQWVREYRYWGGWYPSSDFYTGNYVSAEVIFQKGIVVSWRTLPRPVG